MGLYNIARLVLFCNRELRIADHYLRPLSESYTNDTGTCINI